MLRNKRLKYEKQKGLKLNRFIAMEVLHGYSHYRRVAESSQVGAGKREKLSLVLKVCTTAPGGC